MIILNLLPKKEQKEINIRKGYKLTKDILILLLIVAGFVSIFILIAKFIITKDMENITLQDQTINQGSQGLNNEIIKYNIELKRLSLIQKDNESFLNILIKLSDIITEGITLSEISISQNAKDKSFIISIKAKADTRNNLINFIDKFNAEEFLDDVELSWTTLFKQNNIEFDITTQIFPNKISNN